MGFGGRSTRAGVQQESDGALTDAVESVAAASTITQPLRASGIATIADSTTSIEVTHGLGVIPNYLEVNVRSTESPIGVGHLVLSEGKAYSENGTLAELAGSARYVAGAVETAGGSSSSKAGDGAGIFAAENADITSGFSNITTGVTISAVDTDSITFSFGLTSDVNATSEFDIHWYAEAWSTGATSTAVNTTPDELYPDYDECNPTASKAVGPLLPQLVPELFERREVQARLVGQARGWVEGQDQSFDWLGVETSISPSGLADRQLPYSLNVNTVGRSGTLMPRHGLVRMQQKGTSQVTGVSIDDLGLYSEDGSRAYMLACGDSSAPALLDEALYQTVVVPQALPLNFKPSVTLSSSSLAIDVAISAISHVSGIEHVLVRWSTSGYPTSTFADSERKSGDGQTFAWEGDDSFSDSTTTTFTEDDVYFVSVWLKSGLGWSRSYRGKVTIAS